MIDFNQPLYIIFLNYLALFCDAILLKMLPFPTFRRDGGTTGWFK